MAIFILIIMPIINIIVQKTQQNSCNAAYYKGNTTWTV